MKRRDSRLTRVVSSYQNVALSRFIEQLEQRRLLAASINAGLLQVAGNAGDNVIVVDIGNLNTVVTIDGTPQVFNSADITVGVKIEGLDGNDSITIVGPAVRNATIVGGLGHDTITSGAGDDQIYGGLEDTEIRDDGDDVMDGGLGADFIVGGGGDDTVTYASRSTNLSVILGDGLANDGAAGEGDNIHFTVDTLIGGSGNDYLAIAIAGNRRIIGGDGNDTLVSGPGDDTLHGGNGADVFTGGAGIDWVDYSSDPDPNATRIIRLNGQANSGRMGENDLINTDIENARGSDGDDTFIGPSNVGNRFVGGWGNDTVDYSNRTAPLTITQGDGLANDGESGEGDEIDITIDTIIGGSGNDHITFTTPGTRRAEGRNGSDTLVSTSGNDTLIGGNGADSLQGGAGEDYLDGGDGDDSLDGGPGADVIIGGAGNDTVYYLLRSQPVSVTDDGIANDGEPGEGDNVTGVENVVTTSPRPEGFASLSAGSLRIYGTGANDTIDVRLKTGNPNIVVVTLNGTPTEFNKNNIEIIRIWGWEGDDYIELNHGGNDVGISIKSVIYGHEGNDTIQGGKSRDRIYGGEGNDSIQGGNNVDIIYGDEGNDTLWGGHAKDYLVGGEGNDLIYGNDHQDQIYGGSGNDTLYGGYGADRIWGEAGNDLIYGQWHGDTIWGGPGQDTLYGGSGHDRIFDRDGSIDTIFGDEDDDEAEVDLGDIVSGVEVVNRA